MKYAAQFRDMHDAVHRLIVCNTRRQACDVLDAIRATETREALRDLPHLQEISINFRHVPDRYHEERLTVVNGMYGQPTGIPDSY